MGSSLHFPSYLWRLRLGRHSNKILKYDGVNAGLAESEEGVTINITHPEEHVKKYIYILSIPSFIQPLLPGRSRLQHGAALFNTHARDKQKQNKKKTAATNYSCPHLVISL